MKNGSSASTRVMADSNILLYSFDVSEPIKRPIAKTLLQKLMRERRLVLSVQTLNEFYNIARRPNRPFTMSHEEALQSLREFAASCEVLHLTASISFRAFDAIARYSMSLWDALIWSVAKENGLTVIYTEDTQSAPEIEGVRYINPFAESGG